MGEINNGASDQKINNAILKSKLKDHAFYYHSSSNKRGVAMLIHKKLGLVPVSQYRDQSENALIVKFSVGGGGEVCLGSIYGPNSTDREFYNFIQNVLNENATVPIIMGGDWNTTWDNSHPPGNIDILKMARAPNNANGRLLRELANKFNLTDPFRALYPEKIAFTYSPFGTQRKNKSRLDFLWYHAAFFIIFQTV
jgi:exonuclease III